MPDDTKTITETGELVPLHLADTDRQGALKQAQLRAGHGIAPVIPTTLEEAYRYAVAICKAGLAPDSYNRGGNGPDKDEPDEQKILIGILKSLEVGLPPITGLSSIAIINRRPCIWGDGAQALIQRSGWLEKYEEIWEGDEKANAPQGMNDGKLDYSPQPADFKDDYACIVRMWRRGQEQPYEGRFSVRDAKRAHLWGNSKRDPWIKYPKRMLKMRARAFPQRDGFADCLAGLSIREEVEDTMSPLVPAHADMSFLDDAPQAALPAPAEMPMDGMAVPEPSVTQNPGEREPSTSRQKGDALPTEPRTWSTPQEPHPAPSAGPVAGPHPSGDRRSGSGEAVATTGAAVAPRSPQDPGHSAQDGPQAPDDPPNLSVYMLSGTGGRGVNWPATKYALVTAFRELKDPSHCSPFRQQNAKTIDLMRTSRKDLWVEWNHESSEIERQLKEGRRDG